MHLPLRALRLRLHRNRTPFSEDVDADFAQQLRMHRAAQERLQVVTLSLGCRVYTFTRLHLYTFTLLHVYTNM